VSEFACEFALSLRQIVCKFGKFCIKEFACRFGKFVCKLGKFACKFGKFACKYGKFA
jgi:hypothetical protein